MEEGDLSSLMEGSLLLTQQNHYVVSNTYISAEQPFPTPSPSPSIILRSPAAVPPASPGQARSPIPSPARPNTPQPAMTQYSSITPNTNQLVQLLQNQSRTQIIQTTTAQAAQLKGKQPQQILPKPLGPGAVASKPSVARLTPTLAQQSTPLLINQPQHQNPTLLLNQVLTPGGPMLVQQAGPGGTVHLMLRQPSGTLQSGPGPPQNKMVIGTPQPQQQPTVLIQQNRQQQVMRLMTNQGCSMQVQLQQIQTPSGPQIIAIPANQAMAFPTNSVLVQNPAGGGTIHLQPQQLQAVQAQQQQMQVQVQQQQQQQQQPQKKKSVTKRPKPIKARSDSATSPPSSREDMPSPIASPKMGMLTSPLASPPPVPQPQKNLTSSLRQIRPTAFNRKQTSEPKVVDEQNKSAQAPAIDNLTATINSVAENIRSPSHDDLGLGDASSLNLNKRPNLTIFQKNRPEEFGTQTHSVVAHLPAEDEKKKTPTKKAASKKKGKKDESKVDLLDLMKSAGIGDDEFDEIAPETIEISASDSDLLAQIHGSQTLQLPGNLRLAVGEDGRPVLIDANVLMPEPTASQSDILADSGALLNLTPQALATAQNQLSQLLQDRGVVSSADQQLLSQIFTVNSNQQGLGGVTLSSGQQTESKGTETEPPPLVEQPPPAPPPPPPPPPPPVEQKQPEPQVSTEFVGMPPPGLPPLGPDSLVITNNNGVPTLVASPALLQYLQAHQGIIQFQHDPVTKAILPSLIIPHPSPQQQQQHQQQHQNQHQIHNHQQINNLEQQQRQDARSPRLVSVPMNQNQTTTQVNKDNVINNKGIIGGQLESGQSSLANILRNQTVPTGVKVTMARMIQENPSLLQVARDTSRLITYKESCSTLTEDQIAEIDRKIQANKSLLDQCFHMEVEKSGGKDALGNQVISSTQALQDLDMALIKNFQGPPSTNSPTANSDFQNKFLESIGMSSPAPAKSSVGVGTSAPSPVPPAPVLPAPTSAKKSKKKKADTKTVEGAAQTHQQQTAPPQNLPPVGNLTFNIKQLTPEQNEKLNIALNARGVTANQVAMCEMTEVEKRIIEEEIQRVTGGVFGNTTFKFFPPPAAAATTASSTSTNTAPLAAMEEQPGKVNASTFTSFTTDDDQDHTSTMVLNNPNLNQLLETPVGGQLVSLGNSLHSGNQVLTLGSPPPPGSVILGSNGNVVAFLHHPSPPTLQLTAQKQQMLKSVQSQMQVLNSKTSRTPVEQATLQKLAIEQQKIISSGKLITSSPHHSQAIQIVQPGMQRVYQSSGFVPTSKPSTTAVSCGTSTADMPSLMSSSMSGGKPMKLAVAPTVLMSDSGVQYGPLHVSPNTSGKNVTKCEKGTSPIQIQMGTQTLPGTEFRGGKMSTGTMTSPNTGKPQAVVAPAVVHHQQPEPVLSNNWIKQPRRLPSPISRTVLIEKQMVQDQSGASHPDTHTPYLSKSDAVKRLVRYHVMDEKGLSAQDLQAADDMFETTSQHLLDKFRVMKEKYKCLLLMESMREVSTAERIMVDRNFIIEERIELEDLREHEKRTQDEFENPPPPPPPSIKTEIKEEEPRVGIGVPDVGSSARNSDSEVKCEDNASTSQPDPADISAQVQSAIDSILNLQQSEDLEDEKRGKRKRPRPGQGAESSRKRGRGDGEGDGDPVLDEAIRSILDS